MTIYRATVTTRAALEAFLAHYAGRQCCLPLVVLKEGGAVAKVTVWVRDGKKEHAAC